MYNQLLPTFVCAADCGSFTKAAEKLFLSPTAVMKQLNTLEKHLDVKLMERTPAGIQLTPAGEIIYKDAKFLFDYSRKSISRIFLTINCTLSLLKMTTTEFSLKFPSLAKNLIFFSAYAIPDSGSTGAAFFPLADTKKCALSQENIHWPRKTASKSLICTVRH